MNQQNIKGFLSLFKYFTPKRKGIVVIAIEIYLL